MVRLSFVIAALLPGLAACTQAQGGIDPRGQTFDGVAPDETITLVGTEPFWNVRIAGGEASYSNPDHPEGMRFAVSRFAGNGGLGFSGTLFDAPFIATLTPGQCSDGMSDQRYPFVATIALDGETLQGCGYTDSQPFTGGEGSSEGEMP
ncbi:MAG: COG3650 family protein [Erythrobacter sp.]